MEAAMRKALFLAIMGTLLLAAMVEVVAAGVKTLAVRSHFYAAAPAKGGRDSSSCEHEKLSDRAVAAVIFALTFS